MTGTDEENMEVHIEKEEDDEEIQGRNEVSFAVNDYCSDFNRNKQITIKSKDKEVDELIKIALEALREDFYTKKKEEKDKPQPGTA